MVLWIFGTLDLRVGGRKEEREGGVSRSASHRHHR
jgi:hypothetical protein